MEPKIKLNTIACDSCSEPVLYWVVLVIRLTYLYLVSILYHNNFLIVRDDFGTHCGLGCLGTTFPCSKIHNTCLDTLHLNVLHLSKLHSHPVYNLTITGWF